MSSNLDDSSDSEGISYISPNTLASIDHALNRAVQEAKQEIAGGVERPVKRRRVSREPPEEPAGGFVVEENGENFNEDNGGFVTDGIAAEEVSDDHFRGNEESHIPLSLVPRALQILDLNPSDQDTLSVFANAAEQPSPSDSRAWSRNEEGDLEEVVARKDFRAVCAVLLPETFATTTESGRNNMMQMSVPQSPLSSLGESSDAFEDAETSEDEYVPEGLKKRGKLVKARSPNKSKKVVGEGEPRSARIKSSRKIAHQGSDPQELTSRQKRDALTAFSLFFPELRGEEPDEHVLMERRLGIRDIADAASLIKEKLKAEEVYSSLSPPAMRPDLRHDFRLSRCCHFSTKLVRQGTQ